MNGKQLFIKMLGLSLYNKNLGQGVIIVVVVIVVVVLIRMMM